MRISDWSSYVSSSDLRHHLCIKPLYYASHDGLFLFGSELKALRANPDWHPEIDGDAVAAYMRFGYVPTPHCIWRGARKLAPGTFLTLRQERAPETAPFCSLAECDSSVADMKDDEAVEALDALLRDAVR